MRDVAGAVRAFFSNGLLAGRFEVAQWSLRRCFISGGDAVQKDSGELARRDLIRNFQQTSFPVPQIVIQRVMHDHADKGAHHDGGLNINDGSFALSFPNVIAEPPVHAPHEFLPEHMRQVVLFQR